MEGLFRNSPALPGNPALFEKAFQPGAQDVVRSV